MPRAAIERTIRAVVELLVRRDYAALERLTSGVRLKASEIESGIVDYGRTIVSPPPDAFANLDVIPILGSKPHAYSVRFRLFTKEEGQSDLELQATLILARGPFEQMDVEVDNIRVA